MAYHRSQHHGLGAVASVSEGWGEEGGQNLASLCQDTLFRMMNREACGQDIDPGTRETIPQPAPYTPPPPPPPPPEPTYTGPYIIEEPAEAFLPASGPVPEEPAIVTTTTTTAPGSGWSLQPQTLQPYGSPSDSQVTVDFEAGGAPPLQERGFGLVELAVSAALAWVLSEAYRKRRR